MLLLQHKGVTSEPYVHRGQQTCVLVSSELLPVIFHLSQQSGFTSASSLQHHVNTKKGEDAPRCNTPNYVCREQRKKETVCFTFVQDGILYKPHCMYMYITSFHISNTISKKVLFQISPSNAQPDPVGVI